MLWTTMAAGREKDIADALNSIDPDLRNCDEGWTKLISDYFLSPANDSEESDEESDSENPEQRDDEPENEEGEANQIENMIASVMGQIREDFVEQQDAGELDKITNFSCSCAYQSKRDARPNSCISTFDDNDILQMRLTKSELEESEKDLVLLAKIDSTINMSPTTSNSKRATQNPRTHQRTTFFFRSHQICRDSFKFIHCISQNKLTNLLKFYKEKGCFEPRPKRGKRTNHFTHHLTVEDVRCVVTFLDNYAEDHALCLPERIPGYKRTDVRLLPCFETKVGIHQKHETAMNAGDKRAVKLSSFKNIWEKYVPFITVAKPMTDLCSTCQKYSLVFQRAASLNDQQKSVQLKEYMDHLTAVQEERALYQEMKRTSKAAISKEIQLSPNPACSRDIIMHYSFDYAQQVHYPSNPLQPGPIYFLTSFHSL